MTFRRNRVTNPKAAIDLTNLSSSQSTGTPIIDQVTGAGGTGGPLPGVSTWARATVVGSPTYVDVSNQGSLTNLVAAGETVIFSGYARVTSAAQIAIDAYIVWIDSGDHAMSFPAFVSTPVAGLAVWGHYAVSGVAPVGAVRARLILRLRVVTGTLSAGDRLDVSCLLFESGSVVLQYFDPDINAWSVWEGSPNASVSRYYAPTVSVIPTLDSAPCPRVEVVVTDIHPNATTVTLFRSAGSRELPVRGALNAIVDSALTRIDFEVPFGVDAAYRVQMFDSTGASMGYSTATTVNLDVQETWVHNPLDAWSSAVVAFDEGAARSIQRPFEGEVVWPQGRTVGVVLGGQRRGIQDVVLDVRADTANADKLQAMFGSYGERTTPVICFRIGSRDRVRLPRPFFAGVLTLDERDMNYVLGGDLVTVGMTGSEVDPPTPALVVPLLTRADLNAYYPTRAALNADNVSRLAVNRRYDLAGTSG